MNRRHLISLPIGLALAAVAGPILLEHFDKPPVRPYAPFPVPVQKDLRGRPLTVFMPNNFSLEAKAAYTVDARILRVEKYWRGPLAELSPLDMVLAWGPLAEPAVVDKLSISQSNRWFHWEVKDAEAGKELTPAVLISNMANTHIIPADESLRLMFSRARKGQALQAKGFLVNIRHPDASLARTTSRRRTDTGEGSCEVFYVTDAQLSSLPD